MNTHTTKRMILAAVKQPNATTQHAWLCAIEKMMATERRVAALQARAKRLGRVTA